MKNFELEVTYVDFPMGVTPKYTTGLLFDTEEEARSYAKIHYESEKEIKFRQRLGYNGADYTVRKNG